MPRRFRGQPAVEVDYGGKLFVGACALAFLAIASGVVMVVIKVLF